jgi:hypothetical protein
LAKVSQDGSEKEWEVYEVIMTRTTSTSERFIHYGVVVGDDLIDLIYRMQDKKVVGCTSRQMRLGVDWKERQDIREKKKVAVTCFSPDVSAKIGINPISGAFTDHNSTSSHQSRHLHLTSFSGIVCLTRNYYCQY